MYRKLEKNANKYIGFLLILTVKIFKMLFFMQEGSCRYVPSCSKYAEKAILKYSIWKATIKIIIRIIKCNPFSKGGYDPA